jgi:hypothetical protein
VSSNVATSLRPVPAAECKGVRPFVPAENKIRIALEQRLNLLQATILGCVMNLAAKGGTTPDQRHQHDGGKVKNWGVTDSVRESVHFIHGFSDGRAIKTTHHKGQMKFLLDDPFLSERRRIEVAQSLDVPTRSTHLTSLNSVRPVGSVLHSSSSRSPNNVQKG